MAKTVPLEARKWFSQGLAFSLGLHLALGVLILAWREKTPPSLPPVLTVHLVAPAAGGAALGSTLTAQKEPPSPPGNSKALEKALTAPAAVAKKRGKGRPAAPTPVPTPAESPRLSRDRPITTQPAAIIPPPTTSEASPSPAFPPSGPGSLASSGIAGRGDSLSRSGSGAGGYSSSGPGFGGGRGSDPSLAQSHYLKLIRARILAKRHYPLQARQRHQEGVVRLRFTLSPAGTLTQGVEVVKPSGFAVLDDQARQCVLDAAPFPPFPAELQRSSLTVELPIVYELKDEGG